MPRLIPLAAFSLFVLMAGCSDSTDSGGTTDLDVSGDWDWDEAVGDLSVGVTCADSGQITVSQNETHFTAKGTIAGSCTGPAATVPFADSIKVTSGTISGTSVKFNADGCPYRGTAYGAAPDSASGTITCTASSGGVTVHLTGTWIIRRPPADVQPGGNRASVPFVMARPHSGRSNLAGIAASAAGGASSR
jgi:hypothetical protein